MKITDLIKTSIIKIPDTDIEITIKTELSWFEQLEYFKIEDKLEQGKYLASKLIVNWNLEDEEKKPLAITPEIVGRLPASVGIPLAKEIMKFAEEKAVKKNG